MSKVNLESFVGDALESVHGVESFELAFEKLFFTFRSGQTLLVCAEAKYTFGNDHYSILTGLASNSSPAPETMRVEKCVSRVDLQKRKEWFEVIPKHNVIVGSNPRQLEWVTGTAEVPQDVETVEVNFGVRFMFENSVDIISVQFHRDYPDLLTLKLNKVDDGR